jgi:cellulose synthase/poly-beta-1,6-N-acetylglucosamine synthase-like glycosyltransferase
VNAALVAITLGGAGLVVYSYVLYPVVLLLLAAAAQLAEDLRFSLAKSDRRAGRGAMPDLPEVAVLIAAFNEERHVLSRVHNLLALDYPAGRLKVYVGSDGSTDSTPALLRAIQDPRVHALIAPQNRGKASVLNDLVALSHEPILVFSDANTVFRPDALRRLLPHFHDAGVGGVSGELRLKSSRGDNQDSAFWRMEQALKFFESRIGGLLGANGAIYAIRRELWQPLEADTICDDFVVGMRVAVAHKRLVYEPGAIAEEETPDTMGEEVDRRIRIGVGNLQSLLRNRAFLTRTPLAVRFTYVSHKVLRWVAPHLLILSSAALVALAMTNGGAWVRVAWVVAALGCIPMIAYAVFGRRGGTPRLLRAPTFLFALNWALLVASWRYATGRYQGSWQRSAR